MTSASATPNSGPGYAKNPGYRIDIAPAGCTIRVVFNGETVADSDKALQLLEQNHAPVIYFPPEDIAMGLLQRTGHSTHCPYKGDASYWSLSVGGQLSENAVWAYEAPCDEVMAIKGYFAFYRDRMDEWYEDGERILGSAHG